MFFFCIPIITFGPATAALTHVMRKFILEQPCFVFDEFFTAFKKNFKQSVFIGIVDVIMIVSVWIACFQFLMNESLPDGSLVFICIMICCATLVFIMHFYIYLGIVALNLSIGSILKNAVFLVFLGVKRNFIALIINLAIISLIVLFYLFRYLRLYSYRCRLCAFYHYIHLLSRDTEVYCQSVL